MLKQRWFALVGGICLGGFTGCFSSVHRVQQVQMQAPQNLKSADVDTLERTISERDSAIQTLNASVMIKASTGGDKTGKVKSYTSFRGFIFVQRPRNLRVLLQLPFVGSRALDMVSDGSKFTLLIPPRSQAITGTNEVSKPSTNGLENLRPAVFLDSLLVPGVTEDELVALRESTHVLQEGKGRKATIEEPDYDLEIFRLKSGKTLKKERVVHFNRTDLLPFQQDVLDDQGHVVTEAQYENYQPGEPEPFPHLITIRRPLDQYELQIEVTKLTFNQKFDADQFEFPRIPPSFKVQHID